MILTEELFNLGLARGRNINATQLKILGETFKRGWKKRLIGKEITEDAYKQYVELKGVRKVKAREQVLNKIAKNKPARVVSYSVLLRRIEWKEKRIEILTRDGNKCTNCGGNDILHVHHTYYFADKIDPWLYPNESLITLCEKCHNQWHKKHTNVIINKPRPKKKMSKYEKYITPLKQYRVETRSFSGKSTITKTINAKNKDEVIKKMQKLKLPIYDIRLLTFK